MQNSQEIQKQMPKKYVLELLVLINRQIYYHKEHEKSLKDFDSQFYNKNLLGSLLEALVKIQEIFKSGDFCRNIRKTISV